MTLFRKGFTIPLTCDRMHRQIGIQMMGMEFQDHAKDDDSKVTGKPARPEQLLEQAAPPLDKTGSNRQLFVFLGFLAFLVLLTAAWRWTPLSEFATPERLSDYLGSFEHSPSGIAAVFLAVIIATLLMVPLSVMVVVCALLLGPWLGFGCAMAGALVSACLAFLIGQAMGGEIIERFSESAVHRLSKRMSERGVMSAALLRLLPVAPYTIVNLVAGASHLRLGAFMLGSAIGLVPGVAAITAFSGTLFRAVTHPDGNSLGVLAVLAGLMLIVALVLRRILK